MGRRTVIVLALGFLSTFSTTATAAVEVRHLTLTTGGVVTASHQSLVGEQLVGRGQSIRASVRSGFAEVRRVLTAPQLSRHDGATVESVRPTLDWSDVPFAMTYVLELASNPQFSNADVIRVTTSQYTPPQDLPNGTWYWRVRSLALDRASAFADSDHFRIFRPVGTMPTLAFGAVDVGLSSSLEVVLPNDGDRPMRVTRIEISGAAASDFTTTPLPPFTIAAGSVRLLEVSFTPTSNGSRAAVAKVVHTGSGGPLLFDLTGSGTVLTVDADSASFPQTNVGGSSTAVVTLRNGSSTAIAVDASTTSADFTVDSSSLLVPAGGSQTVTVTYAPTAGGTSVASLRLAADLLSSPLTVSLSASSNQAPVVSRAIPGRVLRLREESFSRNLLSRPAIFTDADGDALTLSVSSSDESVASASVDGGRLSISPVARGRSIITVTAEDPAGLSVSEEFAVIVIRAPRITHINSDDIPTIDGDLSEWEALFQAPHFTSSRFLSVEGDEGVVDDADQDVELWLGWSQDSNQLYVAARVTDDVAASSASDAEVGDNMQIFIDADRSGGEFDEGDPHAQQYVMNADVNGPVSLPGGTANPSGVEAAVLRSGQTTVYEWCLMAWDGNSEEHTFEINERIGLSLAFADFDSQSSVDSEAPDALNSLFGRSHLSNASRFAVFRLGPPIVELTETAGPGSDVMVSLEPPANLETAAVTLEFESIIGSGAVALTTKVDGEDPPEGFRLPESPVYYELEAEAAFTGSVELCFDYSGTSMSGLGGLALLHFTDGEWEDITTSVDEVNNQIYGTTTSFSDFGIMQGTLDAPELEAVGGDTLTDFTPTLSWGDVTDAASYDLEYSTDSGFESADTDTVDGLTSTTYTFATDLVDGTYYWRVKAFGSGSEESEYSDSDDFVLLPAAPTLTAVADIEDPNGVPALDWSDVEGAAEYTLDYATNGSFSSATSVTGLTVSEYTFTSAPGSDTYYWRIRAVGSGGNESESSSADTFAIKAATPVLVTFGGATQDGTLPTFDWGDVTGADSYVFEWADNAVFVAATEVSGLTASEYSMTTPMADGTYYWRVKAVVDGGLESNYSTSDSFVIIPLFENVMFLALAFAMAAAIVYGRR